MRKYVLTLLIMIISLNQVYGLEHKYANCSGSLKGEQLSVQIRLYNIVTNESREEAHDGYDFMRSIYIPISEWVLTGNNNKNIVSGWDWLPGHFVNVIAYIPWWSYNIEPTKSMVDFDNTLDIKYIPKFAKLKARDSIIIDINYKVNDSIFSSPYNYAMYVKIPFIKASVFYDINQYKDLSNAVSETNHFDFSLDALKRLVLNDKRDYSNFSKIKTDEALRRMLSIAIFENHLVCDCHIVRIKE